MEEYDANTMLASNLVLRIHENFLEFGGSEESQVCNFHPETGVQNNNLEKKRAYRVRGCTEAIQYLPRVTYCIKWKVCNPPTNRWCKLPSFPPSNKYSKKEWRPQPNTHVENWFEIIKFPQLLPTSPQKTRRFPKCNAVSYWRNEPRLKIYHEKKWSPDFVVVVLIEEVDLTASRD